MHESEIRADADSAPRQNSADFRAHVGRITRQSSIFFAGTIFTAVTGYLFKIYVARKLGAHALGVYALGMTATGLIGVFAAGGLPQTGTRYIAAYSATNQTGKLQGFLWRGTGIVILLQLAASVVLMASKKIIANRIYHEPEIDAYMNFFIGLMFVGALTSFFSEVLAGYRDISRRTVIVNFIGTPLLLISVLTFLILGLGLRGYLLGQLVTAAVVLFLLLVTAWRLTPIGARSLPGRTVKLDPQVTAYATTLLGVQILEFLLAQTDRIALGVFTNAADVGVYALALGLTGFVPIALQSVNQIFSPTIAELHAKGEHSNLLRLYQTLTKWTLGLTIPLAFTVMLFARPLMQTFGADFARGWPVLVIVTAGQLINCGVGSVGIMLYMSGQEKTALRIQMILAPIVTVCNFVVIAIWGLVGAAIVSALTIALTNLWFLNVVKNALGIRPSLRGYLQLVPASGITLALLLVLRALTREMRWQFAIVGISALVAYGVFLLTFSLRNLDEDDRFILMATWNKIRQVSGA
jgi:O-antigen/teichoic acid export membrane protein